MSDPVHNLATEGLAPKRSLAELRLLIKSDSTLSEARRRDMASALSSLAKALGYPAEAVAADPVVLRPLLAGVTAAMAGKKIGRWRNVLSGTSAAMAHVGIVLVQGRIREAPSALWQQLLAQISPKTGSHFHLGRFSRYATLCHIEPADVTDAVIATYRADLETRSLVGDPKRSAREVARAWNAQASMHSAWPQIHLTVPDNRKIFSPEWSTYPPSLIEDVEAVLTWLATDDPFVDRPSSALRPASIITRRKQIRLIIGALVEKGVDLQSLSDLTAVVTVARAKLALTYFWEKAGKKPSSHVHQLAGVILSLARHWVHLPERDVKLIKSMADKLRMHSNGLTERNTVRLRALEDRQRFHQLISLPADLLAAARHLGPPSVKAALLVQTAVAIEIELFLPLRLGNLLGLKIGESLITTSKGQVFIAHSDSSVKNRTRIDAPLPSSTANMIALYIKSYRPLLATAGGGWLFPGMTADAPKSSVGLRDQLTKAIATYAGLAWNPHLFRHFSALMILRNNPGAHGQVQRILGHKSLHSTMSFYSGLETTAAVVHYDALIMNHRKHSARPIPPEDSE